MQQNEKLAEELHKPIIRKEECIQHSKTRFRCRFNRYAINK